MNKKQWTYMDEKGVHTQIGMFHHPLSGNFMVYCGKKIALAEFEVFETSSFSFFFGEELCKIHIIKNGDNFEYTLEAIKDVDTPLNRKRQEQKKKRKKRNYLGLGMGIVLFALSALVVLSFIQLHKNHLKGIRERTGEYTTGTILITKQPSSYVISYVFGAKGKTFFRPVEYYKEANPVSPNGFPFYQGDEFNVLFAKASPDNHEIQYNNPTKKQLRRYHNRTRLIHFQQHPSITDTLYCDCLLQSAYDLKALDGYLDFYYQKTAPSKNHKHNIKTYLEFIRSKAFLEKARICEAGRTARENAMIDSLQNIVPIDTLATPPN